LAGPQWVVTTTAMPPTWSTALALGSTVRPWLHRGAVGEPRLRQPQHARGRWHGDRGTPRSPCRARLRARPSGRAIRAAGSPPTRSTAASSGCLRTGSGRWQGGAWGWRSDSRDGARGDYPADSTPITRRCPSRWIALAMRGNFDP
jgi:hypothetical protein